MTVDITQEEMNILNLNGLKTEDVAGSIQMQRMQGMSDDEIRRQYDDLLNTLKPITKTNYNDTANIQKWNNEGGITPFEYGKKAAYFDNSNLVNKSININEHADLTADELEQLNRVRANYKKFANEHPDVLERYKRINNGTASLGDKIASNFSFVPIHDDGKKLSQKVADIVSYEMNQDIESYNRQKEEKQGKIGFWEELAESYKSDEWIPVLGGFIKGDNDRKKRELAERVKNGEDIRPDELEYLNKLVEKQKEENVRGRTFGSKIAKDLLPSLVRFGGEMALGNWVLKGLGVAPELAATGRTAEGVAFSTLKDKAIFGAKDMLATGTVNTLNPLTGTSETYAAYQERRLNDEFEITSKGKMIFKEAEEKPATAFMKSMLGVFLMFASEGAGTLIGIPISETKKAAKIAASPIAAYIKSNPKIVSFTEKIMPKLSDLYNKTLGIQGVKGTRDFLKSAVHYDGFLEEIGEEKLEDLLDLTFGVNNEERTLENYTKTFFASPDEWAVLTGSVMLQGLILGGTSHIIGKVLEEHGATDDEIADTIKSLPLENQEKIVSQMIDNGTITLDKPILNDKEAQRKNVEETVYNKILKGNVSKDVALSNAKLFGKFFENFGNNTEAGNKKFNELLQKLEFRYNIPADQQQQVFNQNDISVAGADNNELEIAAQEWKEKGTESSFFQKWFGDSKVVDENGKPLIVYHGTPNGGFLSFKEGSYFTSNQNYAENYKNKGASSLSVKQTADNPQLYKVYLQIKKPFDTRNEKERNIFLNEYQAYYSPELSERGLVDWMEVEDLAEWLKENHPEYDGIFADEGGVLDENNNLKLRGISYIPFSPSQIKSVDNRGTFDENNPNIYYQGMLNPKDDINKRTDKTKYLTDNEVAQLEKDKENFNTYIGKLLNGELKPETQIRVLQKLPSAYNKISNLKGKKLVINQEIYKKIIDLPNIFDKNHYIDRTRALKLPEFVSDPLYILQSTSEGNEHRYIVVANTKGKKPSEKLSVIIEPKYNAVVVSAYDEIIDISKEKKAGRVLYDKKKELSKTTVASMARTIDNSNNIITNSENNLNPSVNKHEDFDVNSNIENNFGDSVENITEGIKADILNILQENDISEDEFSIDDIKMYGSYTTGQNNKFSDVDFLVEYSGTMREDDAFNMFADSELKLTDINGNEIDVDINPIRADKSGTIDEFLERNKDFKKNKTLFQTSKKDNSSAQLGLFDNFMQLNLFKQEQIFEQQTDSNQTVQTEINDKYEIKDVKEKQLNENISDVGDSLLGNLKRNKKQYTWQELDTMNDLLRKKYLSKSYIYQLPSTEEFKSQGFSDNAIAYVNLVYSKINSKPAKNYDDKKEYQKIYFDSVQDIMTKTIDFAKNNKEYFDSLSSGSKRNDELFKIIFPDKEHKNKFNIFVTYPEYNKQAIIVGGNKLVSALQIGYSTIKDIQKHASLLSTKNEEKEEDKADDKENITGWKKHFAVVNTYKGWFVADRKSGMIISQSLPSENVAENLAELLYNEINKSLNYTDNYQLLRNYIPRRQNNQNVKPEALIEVFGFRGINFGNWTKQQERQDFINSTYDFLYDLAELLNLPPKALSLGGKLGLAFGAQGRSGAAGHFIPEYNEINLTRKSGAGTLAHEWWHALDYYFGDQSKGKEFSGTVSLSLSDKGELRDVIFEALQNIKNEMMYSPMTEDEINDKSSYLEERALKRIQYWADDIKNTFAKSKNADKIAEYIDDIVSKAKTIDTSDDTINQKYISLIDERRKTWDNLSKITNLTYSISNLQKVNDIAKSTKKYSTYYENAKKLDDIEKGHGKGYWSRNTELGARAFSSYILNRMAEKNFKNNFLARDEQYEKSLNLLAISKRIQAKINGEEYKGDDKTFIEWYPAEPEERQRIFAAFDNLFNNIKTKEQNGTTILYQSAYHGTPHKFDKFSTDKIGTGEGYQAHGWGLYFAGNKEISENYRKILVGDTGKYSVPVEIKYDGKDITEINNDADLSLALEEAKNNGIEAGIQYLNDEIQKQKDYIENYKNTIEKIKKGKSDYFSLEEYQDGIKDREEAIKVLNKNIDFVKSIDMSKLEVADREKGQLYEADIPENDVLLDEDLPFNEQPEKVQEALNKIADEFVPKHFLNNLKDAIDNNKTGEDIYHAIKSEIESLNSEINFNNRAEYTSKLLNKYGIKGITYDGRSDGRCYVIFDDKAISILKTYYQETNDDVDEDFLIAGFSGVEVMNKLGELYNQQAEFYDQNDQKALDEVNAKIHILEDALVSLDKSSDIDNDKLQDIYINTYYIMNNQEIPDEYIEFDKKSQRTFKELSDLHKQKLEEREKTYRGYFTEQDDKTIITIMQNSDPSTALHELGHFFLKALNELAKVDSKAQKMLDEVNKKLGATYGSEYTVQQQEKFAASFEAYLYNGKAPNNTLRKVFEQFKDWLKSVYHHVTDIENADISPEMQKLFDKIFGDDEYYEEKKQAKELLEKINKAAKKLKSKKVETYDDSKLDETQKRHKEVSYEILSAATGKSVKYLKTIFETSSKKNSFGKKREAIENLIANVDDKITISTGFDPHWAEFYTDTGVSYENDDIKGDYKLAEQALNTIINKTYKTSSESFFDNALQEEAEYLENEIANANRQYKILLSAFKNENRNVALAAYYEWINTLDNRIQEDYEDKFTYDMALIERNENIDKFDKAKRNIIAAALDIDNQYNINNNEKYKQTVLNIMKNLDFLQPSDKAKLTTNVLDIGSTGMLMSQIDSILDIAKTMEDVNYRRKLEHDIHKELQGTKNVRKNGRTVGKYNYKANKIFEELRNLDRLSPEMANEYRLENKKFADAEDNGLSYKDKLINKFLSYKAGGRTFADTELMKELYDEITRIKLAGKCAKSEQDLQEKLSEEKDIDELINIIQQKKNAKITTKAYINMFGNLESIINALFNKEIKDRYAAEILYDETQAQSWQYEQKKYFEENVAKIYNLPQWLWDKKIIEYLNQNFTYTEYRRKYDKEGNVIKTRNINRTLTKMDIIQAYIWSKNDILEKRLINQFGENQLYSMFDELSLEDVKLAELMMRTAQSYYPMVNKAFIDKYGLDLPKVSCYFPSTPERGSEVDLYNDYSSKSLGNGFTKSRASSEILPMDFHNPIATLYNHIDGVAKFIFMSKNLDAANIRFRNTDLKRAIIDKYGEDAYRSLEQSLMNITYKKEAPVFNGYQKVLDNLTGNWIQANVAIKPIVGLKQLLSANNYAVDMPYMTWQIGFLKAIAQPKKTIDYMMKIPYLKARYGGSFSNEFLKQTIENSAFATTKKLKDLCNVFIKTGDIGAIIFGGKPYIDYLIKEKGISEADAIKQFILSTNRSQQSSAVSSLSNFQVAATRNPIGKLFIAYKNSPQQYIRMCGDAIISATNGDISKVQAARLLFQYGYLQPFLYAAATSGSFFRLFFTGDDDDLLNDLKVSLFNLGSDAMPILGDIYKYAINRLVFKEKYVATTTPLLGDIENEIGKLAKDDISAKEFFEALGYIILHAGAGYNTKAVSNEISGAGDIATGDIEKGSMKVLGYTQKRAERITKK